MELRQLVERLTEKLELHETEAAAFASEVDGGRDIFESECGQRYHNGCADTIRETLELLSMLYIPDDKEQFANPPINKTPS